MSTVVSAKQQVGINANANNNFVWRTDNDGTLRLFRGNHDAEGAELLRVNADGSVTGPFVGSGQVWQDVTASRATGVTYSNDTNRPRAISITTTSASNGSSSILSVEGVEVAKAAIGSTTASILSLFTIVPPGEEYEYTGRPFQSWLEL